MDEAPDEFQLVLGDIGFHTGGVEQGHCGPFGNDTLKDRFGQIHKAIKQGLQLGRNVCLNRVRTEASGIFSKPQNRFRCGGIAEQQEKQGIRENGEQKLRKKKHNMEYSL